MRFPKWTALGAGVLSAIGFAPIGWWPVTLVCFALLMHLVWQADSWRPAAARGYWFGVGHFTVGLNWIAGSFQYQDAMPHWLGWFAVVAVALYLAVYPALCAGAALWLAGARRPPAGGGAPS
jgi:apolipoprotein N-acyltransferase